MGIRAAFCEKSMVSFYSCFYCPFQFFNKCRCDVRIYASSATFARFPFHSYPVLRMADAAGKRHLRNNKWHPINMPERLLCNLAKKLCAVIFVELRDNTRRYVLMFVAQTQKVLPNHSPRKIFRSGISTDSAASNHGTYTLSSDGRTINERDVILFVAAWMA